jgi:hypothetical protein
MKNALHRAPAVALAFALLALPAAAFAETQVPTREGNVWNWRDHQPTEAQVQRDERAAGIAPTQPQQDANAATVDQLYRALMDGSPG